MAYKGKYKIKNPEKYIGDVNNCIYRSSWERALMHWCDISSKVTKWGVEQVKIPYVCETDKKIHTYHIDFVIKFKNIKTWYLIEVKPDKETRPPGKIKNKFRFFKESFKWAKNSSKWAAATIYAARKNMKFEVWTENNLRELGLKIL